MALPIRKMVSYGREKQVEKQLKKMALLPLIAIIGNRKTGRKTQKIGALKFLFSQLF
ncbi:MAG: hypothetical protein J6X49_12835 [Victivallales bacterium]|nr:hypothetical protein [Victivallales bacterium]